MKYITLQEGEMWFGNVPDHWEIKRIGHLYHERKTKVSDKDFPPLSVTMQGILPQLEHAAKTDAHDDRKLIRKGDFVINSRSDRRGSCGISPSDGSCSLINTVLEPRKAMSPEYYNWFFHTVRFAEEFYRWGHGIHDDLWATNYDEMKRIFLPVPPLEEQKKIACYLDAKCSAIDEAVRRHKKIIEKLEEHEQSIIVRAVTRGLNANSPLKETNIRWARIIPVHWIPRRIKYSVVITNGSDPQTEGDVPVYGSGAKSFKTCGEHKNAPTVLIGRKGATLHIPHYIDHPYWNVDTAFDTKPINGTDMKWFYYVARCLDYKYFITQTTLPSMTQTDYGNMAVPAPPISEQSEIARFLDNKTTSIRDAINRHNDIISKLEEYKKSLIYNAVTGKIDCREEIK